jgi:hypothetical protein
MEARLRGIAEKCAGRNYDIGTSGLTPVLDTHEQFIDQVNLWLKIVHAVFDGIAK